MLSHAAMMKKKIGRKKAFGVAKPLVTHLWVTKIIIIRLISIRECFQKQVVII